MLLRQALVAAVSAALLLPGASVAAAELSVSVSAPQYESPGGLVPVIVTAYNPPSGYAGTLSVKASNGATVRCTGANWFNPVRITLSRKCYVQLPVALGSHVLTGHAEFTKSGATTITASGQPSRALLASGYASPTTMSVTEAQTIERCHNGTSRVQLTFDDSAGETKLRAILGTLKANNAKGRFFFTGTWAAANPGLLALIKQSGHLVANHTKSHQALSEIGKSSVLAQISGGVRASTIPKLLRPPYGAGSFTTRLRNIAAEQSYKLCRWTTDPYDWEDAPADVLIERVRYGDRRSPPVEAGGVILLHGHGRYTAVALQGIIDVVREKGLSLEPLAP